MLHWPFRVKWPIRIKLYVGLSVVVGMMLTLMGGSIFGLHAFHSSNLTTLNQLRELGAATGLLKAVMQLEAMRGDDSPGGRRELEHQVRRARAALEKYYNLLDQNSHKGNRADDGRDEFSLAFSIDQDLVAILRALNPLTDEQPLPRTRVFLRRHPSMAQLEIPAWGPGPVPLALLSDRFERLNESTSDLPGKLYRDFWVVSDSSKRQYELSRVIVWTSALAVLAMLFGLSSLVHRWVLYPVRLLQRGVRRVARGQFDYRIELQTGDEMQSLAEAYNEMATRLGATYADLERQVQERSRQLVRSERLAGVGFLAAGVAHEINNPLASIAFCSEALENRLSPALDGAIPGADSKVVRDYLRMIQEEAFRCKRITEKLLDFSRCNDIQRERTELGGLVQGVVEMIRHMGKYRTKHVAFAPREAVFALVDPQEIKQVVLNLVVNALDSMEPGGTLRIELRDAGGKAEVAFADDGCGMSPDVLENIFEPFFTRRKTGKGTGLGLSITHRIIAQHHGDITAESPGEGRGATFTVRLPVQPTDDADEDSPASRGGTRAA